MRLNATVCSATNTQTVEQTGFFSSDGHHDTVAWDPHRIGWSVAGSMAVITILLTTINITVHARNYYRPLQQRQIIRILLMPPVFATISFFSYRYFRDYTYYSLVETVYGALGVSAFFMLLIQYVSSSPAEGKMIFARKSKKNMLFPFCCWRYRPGKPHFMHTLKWAVLQYCLFSPLITIAGIVTEKYNVLCPDQYSVHFAAIYLDSANFVSSSVALYALLVFYTLTKENLEGRQPLAKFLSIKLIIFFTFDQRFLFGILQSHSVIKGTTYWTATNVADGLQALCTCIEMVFFTAFMMWSFSSKEYRALRKDRPHTNPFMAFLHSLNYWDFIQDAAASTAFFFKISPHKSQMHSDFDSAFDTGDTPNISSSLNLDEQMRKWMAL